VTWLLPELDDGEEPELRPPEVELDPVELEPVELEPVELDPVELEPVELEPVELDPVELDPVEPEEAEPEEADPLELEPVELVPALVDALACVDPGRTSATTPAAATLAMVTAVVAVLTLPRPRSLAAMARRIPSRSVLLM
jgi:hypothetical protein